MRILCICAKADPVGYLTVEGNALTHDDLSLLIGRPVSEIVPLMNELSTRGVSSRDASGRIYNRRMVRDCKKTAVAKKNGKLGGNPSLSNQKENISQLNPHLKAPDKPHSHKPQANSLPASPVTVSVREAGLADEKCESEMLPSNWHTFAEQKGIPDEQIYKSWRKFKEVSSFPFELYRWKKWIDGEKVKRTA